MTDYVKRNAIRRGTAKTGDKPLPAESGSGGAYLMCTPASAVNSVVAGTGAHAINFTGADVIASAGTGIAIVGANLSLDPAGAFVVSYYLDISSWNGNIDISAYSEDFGLTFDDRNFDPNVLAICGSSFVVPPRTDDVLGLYFTPEGTGTNDVQPQVTVLRVS
jgi:hypothetical protein